MSRHSCQHMFMQFTCRVNLTYDNVHKIKNWTRFELDFLLFHQTKANHVCEVYSTEVSYHHPLWPTAGMIISPQKLQVRLLPMTLQWVMMNNCMRRFFVLVLFLL